MTTTPPEPARSSESLSPLPQTSPGDGASGPPSADSLAVSLGPMLAKLREDSQVERQHAVLIDELAASRAREEALTLKLTTLTEHHVLRTQEFQHRLINGMQLIVSLLSMQGRTAASPEAAAQLNTAAKRVAALGKVHRQLLLLEGHDHVQLRDYLRGLCVDLTDLMFESASNTTIAVQGDEIRIESAIAISIGFIVAELTTNAVKYASGDIAVRLSSAGGERTISVVDRGPGLPAGFDPSASKGLGMKIIKSLVSEIGGSLSIVPGTEGLGAHFRIAF